MQLEVLQETLLDRPTYELFAATLLTHLGDWCDQLPYLISGELPKSHRRKISDRLRRELDDRREQLAVELKQGPGGKAA